MKMQISYLKTFVFSTVMLAPSGGVVFQVVDLYVPNFVSHHVATALFSPCEVWEIFVVCTL